MNHPALFRKRSPVFSAIKFTGDNLEAVKSFLGIDFTAGVEEVVFFDPNGEPVSFAPGWWFIVDTLPDGRRYGYAMDAESFNAMFEPAVMLSSN